MENNIETASEFLNSAQISGTTWPSYEEMLVAYADRFIPKWISVEKSLPNDCTIVRGYSEDYNYSCDCLYEIEKGGFCTMLDASWDQSEFGDSVTHWQPLPSPPKQ